MAATRQTLWLSIPRAELVTARPVVPGTLALEVATALLGRRATYRHLDGLVTRVGARDAFAPPRPDAAISADEHLLACAAAGPEDLAAHPWARRLLRLYRAIDRAHRPAGETTGPTLDAWSGHVPRDLVAHPARGDAPVPAALLAEAIATPSTYFFRRVLGAYRPKWLGGANRPSDSWVINRRAGLVIERLAARGSQQPDEAAVTEAIDAVVAAELGPGGDADTPEEQVGRALVEAVVHDAIARFDPLVPGPRMDDWDGAPLGAGTWRITGEGDYVGDQKVVAWAPEPESAAKWGPEKACRVALQALALTTAGETVDTAEVRRLGASRRPPRFDAAETLARVEAAWRRVGAGVWPVEDPTFTLHTEGALDDEARDALVAAVAAVDGRGTS